MSARPRCPHCSEPAVASGDSDPCQFCGGGLDEHGNRCMFCDGTGWAEDFYLPCGCDFDDADENEVQP
jgi:hypothetical protein